MVVPSLNGPGKPIYFEAWVILVYVGFFINLCSPEVPKPMLTLLSLESARSSCSSSDKTLIASSFMVLSALKDSRFFLSNLSLWPGMTYPGIYLLFYFLFVEMFLILICIYIISSLLSKKGFSCLFSRWIYRKYKTQALLTFLLLFSPPCVILFRLIIWYNSMNWSLEQHLIFEIIFKDSVSLHWYFIV